MKKTIAIAFAALVLAGCENSATIANFPVMPEGLEDCKVYHVQNTRGIRLYITRCPHSDTSTSYKSGKTHMNTITINGDKYVKQSETNESEIPK